MTHDWCFTVDFIWDVTNLQNFLVYLNSLINIIETILSVLFQLKLSTLVDYLVLPLRKFKDLI